MCVNTKSLQDDDVKDDDARKYRTYHRMCHTRELEISYSTALSAFKENEKFWFKKSTFYHIQSDFQFKVKCSCNNYPQK